MAVGPIVLALGLRTLIWEKLVRDCPGDIAKLAQAIDSIADRIPEEQPRQPAEIEGISDTASSDYLCALNIMFEDVEDKMYDQIKAIAGRLPLRIGKAKTEERSFEKAERAYGGDLSQLKE